jgi:bifunctional enzyme CysN/CysC/sulfate adenylyltransferase subunit 1
MDLVDYSQQQFQTIRRDFVSLCTQLGLPDVTVIPVSALEGENVVKPTTAMPWYAGPTLLEYLETVPLALAETTGPMRFPVQVVLRPDANFRGFAGQVARGTLRAGDRVMALPSRRETTVRRIVTYDGDLPAASHPQSITVELADEIDLSRGEMLVAANVAPDALPGVSNHFRAMVVWMHEDPLVPGRTYIAKHTTRSVRATVRAIRYRVDVGTLDHLASDSIAMNEIAEVEFETNLPLFFDSYRDCRWTGSLILIDPLTNATVGAVMISGALDNVAASSAESETASLILLTGQPDRAARARDALLARGDRAVLIDDPLIADSAVPSVIRALSLAGIIAVSSRNLPQAMLADIESFAGVERIEQAEDEAAILNSLGIR